MLARIKEKDYSRALRIAANNKKGLPLVCLLLSYKQELNIDVNEQSGDDKNAAIHYAAKNKIKEIYDVLVSHEADPTIPNKSGMRPIDIFGPRVKC